MIFDNDYVTELAMQWQRSQDQKVLDLIIDQSMSLIEVIVSQYDTIYRDDLIQEASLRIQYALPFFDQKISNLHNYFTTVIKNICLTYLRKQDRYAAEIDIDIVEGFEDRQLHYSKVARDALVTFDYIESDHVDIESNLIARNRKRFPSIPVETIDDISECVYYGLISGSGKKEIIDSISIIATCTKAEAAAVYISSLIFLRVRYKDFVMITISEYDDEFSIIPDLEELFGEGIADILATALTGMYVKFP